MLKRWRAWIIVVACVAAAIWAVESSHPFQQCIKTGNQEAAQQKTQKGVAYFSAIVSVRRGCLGEFIHGNGEAITATFTVVLAISTILLWLATKRLWESSDRLAERQARETEILQRAYIAVEPGGLVLHDDRPDRLRCRVIFRNVGHLPAKNVRWFGSVKPTGMFVGENEEPEPEVQGFPIGDLFEGSIVLPPGTQSVRNVATLFTYRLQNVAFVWGIVTYEDGFGKSRYTRFCHIYGTKTYMSDRDEGIPSDDAALYHEGNEAN